MEKNLVRVGERRDRANAVGLQLIQPSGIRVLLANHRKSSSLVSRIANVCNGSVRFMVTDLTFMISFFFILLPLNVKKLEANFKLVKFAT